MAIQVLAPDVVDKIAAGEVLERPANLIKELVENSLDADADQIEVTFDAGGREVCVSDNGKGMTTDDLRLCVRRHATSKILAAEDLFKLGSFGFRGEALASISAVSRISLTSRLRGQGEAHRLQGAFGAFTEIQSIAAREGTEVRISELFGNVPARLRFLKSESAEHGQIKTVLKAMALAREDVEFKICSRGELVFHWPRKSLFLDRALDVLPVRALYEGECAVDGVHAQVLVSSPEETVNVNRNMWFFAQGRWIQDRSLSAAVMEAYRNTLMHGEYPTVVVRLSLAPEEIDVNVHPTKAQVKFREGQTVFRVVCRAIRQVLEKSPWLEALPKHVMSSALTWSPPPPAADPEPQNLKFQAPELERTQYSQKTFPLAAVREAVRGYGPEESPEAPATADQTFQWSKLHLVGQADQTYIVAQSDEALYLIDQHAAHERVVFEKLMNSYKLGRVDVQNLLLPMVFDFSQEEAEVLDQHRVSIERLGLTLERLGPESIAVQALPAVIGEGAVSEALRKMAFELMANGDSHSLEKAVGEIFASMACHSVVRAGQALSEEQMRSLLVQMDEYPLSSFCPHGRPVFIRRRFTEIEREFGRIV
jgi:DNA mismatch repair protein MutL